MHTPELVSRNNRLECRPAKRGRQVHRGSWMWIENQNVDVDTKPGPRSVYI